MTRSARRVRVRVPASSANLGPGFDALGLALALHDELEVESTAGGLEVVVEGEGSRQVPLDDSHLVVSAMTEAFELLGVRPAGLRVACRNRIPHGRGLGSSAAAIVGGIAAARALAGPRGDHFDDQAAYQLASDLEGHPDNVAAAMFGGFTVAWIEGGAVRAVRRAVTVPATVFVPPAAVATKDARGLLPETVTHPDAAANAGRAALLALALIGDSEQLFAATEDRIHQSFRAEAMPESHRLLRRLRLEGVPAVISGAGPSVLAFAEGLEGWTPEGWGHRLLAVDPDGVRVRQG